MWITLNNNTILHLHSHSKRSSTCARTQQKPNRETAWGKGKRSQNFLREFLNIFISMIYRRFHSNHWWRKWIIRSRFKPSKELLEALDSSSKTGGSNWYGSPLPNTLYQSFWSFKSLPNNRSSFDLLSVYKKGFEGKIFAQISLRMLPFSVYRVKVKRQKEKCQFFFVHLIFKPISSFQLN